MKNKNGKFNWGLIEHNAEVAAWEIQTMLTNDESFNLNFHIEIYFSIMIFLLNLNHNF